jgi:hypothetical protein
MSFPLTIATIVIPSAGSTPSTLVIMSKWGGELCAETVAGIANKRAIPTSKAKIFNLVIYSSFLCIRARPPYGGLAIT